MSGAEFTPMTVGPYRCQRRLGIGPSGVVYLGMHLETGAQRAIKALDPALLDDPDHADGLLQAIIASRALKHANIAAIHELIEADDQLFVVRDFVEGKSLRTLLDGASGSLSAPQACFIAMQILAGLDHAHHHKPYPIVHGALWPSNVLVGSDGRLKISDFGAWNVPLAFAAEGGGSMRTRYCYRSPEHVSNGDLMRSTDVFSVGILLFEMLTGRSPFYAETLMETVERVEHARVGSMEGIPAELRPLLRQALSAAPTSRPKDAKAMAKALDAVVPTAHAAQARNAVVELVGGRDQPRPLPTIGGGDRDEPTSTVPEGLTDALRSKSRDRTAPGSVADSFLDEGSVDFDDPTVIEMGDGPLIATDTPVVDPPDLGRGSGLRESATPVFEPTPLTDVGAPIAQTRSSPFGVDAHTQISAPPAMEPPPPMAPAPAVDPTPPEEEAEPETRRAGRLSIEPGEDTGVSGPLDHAATKRRLGGAAASGGAQTNDGVEQSVLWGDDPGAADPSLETVSSDTAVGVSPSLREKAMTRPLGAKASPVPSDSAVLPGGFGQRLVRVPLPEAGGFSGDAEADGDSAVGTDPRMAGLGEVPAGDHPMPHDELAEASRVGTTPWAKVKDGRPILDPSGQRSTPLAAAAGAPRLTPSSPGAIVRSERPTPSAVDRDLGLADTYALSSDPAPLGPAPVSRSVSEVGLSFEDAYESNVASFESSIRSFEPSFDPSMVTAEPGPSGFFSRLRARLTPAHALLIVAIVVFLVAVGLLIRRLAHRRSLPAVSVVAGKDASVKSKTPSSVDAGGSKPRPPKPPPRLTQISIDSTPRARIFINGRDVGLTPVRKRYRPGRRLKIVAVASGRAIARVRRRLRRGRHESVRLSLKKVSYPRYGGRRRGWLKVTCNKRDTRRILLNGKDVGFACPKVVFQLRPGRYRVALYNYLKDKAKRARRVRVRRRRVKRIKLR